MKIVITNQPPAPTRSNGSLNLAFGLVNIPVSVYTAVRSTTVERKEYTRTDDGLVKVGRAVVIKDTTVPVASCDVVKCLLTNSGELVEISDDEIRELRSAENGSAPIEAFLPLAVLGSGRYVPHGMVQVRPRPRTPGAERALGLLLSSLRARGVFALVRHTMRGRTSYGALMPTGRMYLLRFDAEVRQDRPLPEPSHTQAELDMAMTIIDALLTDTPPALIDRDSQAVAEHAETKATEGETEAPVNETSPVESLIEGLSASVASAKR